jgi:tetratricopeptide (TPR) repeat protein
MKHLFLVACLLPILCQPADGHHTAAPVAKATEAPLLEGLGNLHHRVSTANPEAQKYFDQGLRLVFAFNHDEAVRSFRKAAELDPKLAMAYWGQALALGPNINLPMDSDHERQAVLAVKKAKSLVKNASEPERAYIEALAVRYTDPPQTDRKALDNAYREAMKSVAERYPDDLDAATLYAESIMDLRPWQFWGADGRPAEDTEELTSVLESVLRRDPWHLGANHYYIHSVEASPHPERAYGSAERLKGLTPGAGHLVHMPSHIFIRTGDYDQAARINDNAAGVDSAYIEDNKIDGIYPLMYYNHNLHFSAVAHALAGRYGEAMRSARKVTEHSKPAVREMPMAEMFTPTTILVQTLFHRWDDLLASPDPGEGFPITRLAWHFARGLGFATRGDSDAMDRELAAFTAGVAAVPSDAITGLNAAGAVLDVPRNILEARIAEARGDTARAIELLQKAVASEDALNYDEPSDWYLHVRPSLGALLLRSGQAADAEKVFRDDLARRPRDGRSLFGLMTALEAQGRTYDAGLVRSSYEAAWRTADKALTLADL